MPLSKSKRNNLIFLIVVALLIIPQTGQPIQVLLHKGIALIVPVKVNKTQEFKLKHYTWQLKDEKGSVFNFEDTQGKVVLVNFWATWCPPCIAEMPSLQELYNDYGDAMEFVFISDESMETINEFMNKNAYTFKVFNSISDHSDIFDVTSIPRTYLIDKDGYICIDKTGAANWNSASVRRTIDKLLQ